MGELFSLFITFAKIGAFTIGGGYAMIPLIQDETLAHGWLTLQEITDLVALSQITPGPIAVNAATFAGTKVAGISGAIFATTGVVLPSVLITLAVSRFFFGFHKNKNVQSVLSGMRPAVTGLILSATLSIACTAFLGLSEGTNFITMFQALGNVDIVPVLIFGVSFVAIHKYKASPVIMVFLAAGAGALLNIIL